MIIYYSTTTTTTIVMNLARQTKTQCPLISGFLSGGGGWLGLLLHTTLGNRFKQSSVESRFTRINLKVHDGYLLFNLGCTVHKVVFPEVVMRVLDELNECDQQSPRVRPIYYQSLKQHPVCVCKTVSLSCVHYTTVLYTKHSEYVQKPRAQMWREVNTEHSLLLYQTCCYFIKLVVALSKLMYH